MANKAAFEAVDSLLRSLTASPLPFGGKILIAVGDFRQVAPVVKGGGLSAAIDASVRTSHLWPAFQIHRLTQPMRNAQDPEFCDYADSIGEDAEGSRDITLQHLPRIYDQEDGLSWLYPSEILLRPDLCIKRSFLAVLNAQVDEINDLMLDRLPGREKVYWSHDTVKEGNVPNLHGDVLADYLGMLYEPGIPSHKLRLKVGAICTVARNLSIENGLVKNARVIIEQLHQYSVVVKLLPFQSSVLLPSNHCRTFPFSRINFEFNPQRSSWTILRRQLPLRLAYATTFNSCQGLTLDKAVLDLRSPVFAHGQLHTALTRFRERNDGRALFAPDNILGGTINIVSKELLL